MLTTLTPLPPPFVSNHVPPSFVSINLYDTRLHLSNVSGLDRIPVQKFLIKPVLYVYRRVNYNLTGLIKQHWREKAKRSMCYDPYLFHLSLSPPQLISLHPHLFISPYFLPHRVWGRKGGDGKRHRVLSAVGPSLSAWLFVLNTHMSLRWHILVMPFKLLDSRLWLLRFMNLPACQLLQIWVIYLHSHQHLSSFRYWRMQCSHILRSIAFTSVCVISLFLCSFLWSLKNCHLLSCLRVMERGHVTRTAWTLRRTKTAGLSPAAPNTLTL